MWTVENAIEREVIFNTRPSQTRLVGALRLAHACDRIVRYNTAPRRESTHGATDSTDRHTARVKHLAAADGRIDSAHLDAVSSVCVDGAAVNGDVCHIHCGDPCSRFHSPFFVSSFLAFVCPEPVLAKDRFSPENGAQGAISAPVALECACRQLTQRQSISTIALTFTHHSSGVCRGSSGNSKVYSVEKGRMWFFFF